MKSKNKRLRLEARLKWYDEFVKRSSPSKVAGTKRPGSNNK